MLRKLKKAPYVVYKYDTVVRFSEVDAMSIVWHGNYFLFFEDGRDGLGEHYGMGIKDFAANGIQAPVVNADISYYKPISFRDKITIETKFYYTRAAKIVNTYKVLNEEEELCVEGLTEQVFIDLKGELQLQYPGFYENWLQQLPWINLKDD